MGSIHIGEMIRRVLKEKRIPVSEFAVMANTERTNMYRILQRASIDLLQLERYSRLLDHDFFRDISEVLFSERDESSPPPPHAVTQTSLIPSQRKTSPKAKIVVLTTTICCNIYNS